jgi:ATP-dependent Clp protease protease subunit
MQPFDPSNPLSVLGQRNREYSRQRQYGTSDILLDNRIIFLGSGGGEVRSAIIGDALANFTIQQLLYLQYENRTQEIHFYINSPGGEVTAALAIYDTMQFLECPISTYCVGMASSMAAILLAGGTKTRRYALPHSRIMIHEPWAQEFGGQASDVEIIMREVLSYRTMVLEILAKHTGKSIDDLRVATERNRFFSAPEAKEFGIVDEVLEKPKEKPKS